MRHRKKLLGLMLALCVCGTLALPVFASSDTSDTPQMGSITIKNVENGGEYKIYRFLIPTDRLDNNPEYTVASAWDLFIKFEQGAACYQSGGSYVRITESNAAESYEALMTYVGGKSIAPTKTATGIDSKAEFINLEPGYYLLDCGNGVGGFFPLEAGEHKDMYNKSSNTPYMEKKILVTDKDGHVSRVDYTTADIGDDVRFEIRVILPTLSDGAAWGRCWLRDETNQWMKINNDIQVSIDGEVYVTAGASDASSAGINANSIEINYENGRQFNIGFNDFSFFKAHMGEEVVITYTAKVEQVSAQIKSLFNKAIFCWNGDGVLYGEIEDIVYIYDFTIIVNKYERGNNVNMLSGAQFVLKRTLDSKGNSDNSYYSSDRKSDNSEHVGDDVKWVQWDPQPDDRGSFAPPPDALGRFIMTTNEYNEKGRVHFEGINVGEYELIEIKAPENYNKLEKPIKIKIEVQDDTDPADVKFQAIIDDGTPFPIGPGGVLWESGWQQHRFEVNVPNSTGFLLPETGGPGAMLVYAFGGVLLLCAAVLLIGRRQKNT